MELIKTPEAALSFFQRIRWQAGIVCQGCGVLGESEKHSKTKTGFQKYCCKACKRVFSDTSGTCLHRKRITPQQFLTTIYELTNKKSITSVRLGEKLGIRQRKAWSILHNVRKGFAAALVSTLPKQFRGVTESDEGNLGKKANAVMVQGILQRGKQAVLIPILDRTELTLKGNLEAWVRKLSYIITDTAAAYGGLNCSGYTHYTLNHSEEEFSKGDGIHSNTIEGLWGNLKKVLYGIHHGVAKQNLFGYTSEFLVKYNLRHEQNLFASILPLIISPPLSC